MTVICGGCLECLDVDSASWQTEMVLHARLNLGAHPPYLRVLPVNSEFLAIMHLTAQTLGDWNLR